MLCFSLKIPVGRLHDERCCRERKKPDEDSFLRSLIWPTKKPGQVPDFIAWHLSGLFVEEYKRNGFSFSPFVRPVFSAGCLPSSSIRLFCCGRNS